MLFPAKSRRLPLVHAHLQEISFAIRQKVSIIPIDEFWHLPMRALSGERCGGGTYDWVLVHKKQSGRNHEHSPVVALHYEPSRTKKLDNADCISSAPLILTIGPLDEARDVADLVAAAIDRWKGELVPLPYLQTPDYQVKLQQLFANSGLVALQEVSLDEVVNLSEKLQRKVLSISDGGKPVQSTLAEGLRFDLVIATPPPMCFALAVIEIDGRHHAQNERNDMLKDRFCEVVELPLLRIGIGSGRGLTDVHNKVHDQYIENYVRWISTALQKEENEVDHIGLLLDTIVSIANQANQQVKSDLHALVNHTRNRFTRLNRLMATGLQEEWHAKANPGDPRSPYYERLTQSSCKFERKREDLYISIEPRWDVNGSFPYHESALPQAIKIGPIRWRLVATDSFRQLLGTSIADDCDRLYGKEFEAQTRVNLKYDGCDTYGSYHDYKYRYNIYRQVRESARDLDQLEKILVKHLGDIPDGRWDRVGVDIFYKMEWAKNLDPQQRKLLKEEGYGPAPIEKCVEYWNARLKGFKRRSTLIRSVIHDSSAGLSSESVELLGELLGEHKNKWEEFLQWEACIASTLPITQSNKL